MADDTAAGHRLERRQERSSGIYSSPERRDTGHAPDAGAPVTAGLVVRPVKQVPKEALRGDDTAAGYRLECRQERPSGIYSGTDPQ